MKILILEDDLSRIVHFKAKLMAHDMYITKCPKEANRWLEEIEFDCILLDHDLAEEAQGLDNNFDIGTGLEVAKFLGNNPNLSPKACIIVHSLNSAGADRMRAAMMDRYVERHPFVWLKDFRI